MKAQFPPSSSSPPLVESIRLFVAVILDKPLQEALKSLIEKLRPLEVPVKWLEPGNLHLTLCFLGDVPKARTVEVMEKLKHSRVGFKSFEIQVGGLGAFPNLKKPTVLFAPVTQGWESLRDLSAAISKNCRGIGAKQADSEFNAHVTLGRVKGFKGAKTIAPRLAGQVPDLIGRMKMNSFSLVQSQLTPSGPIYTRLQDFNLAD